MRLVTLLVCFLFFGSLLNAQTPIEKTFNSIYAKKLYTVEDGLAQGYITCVFEDHHGYLWVGTLNGLNRFDGKSFETFIENPSDSFSVKGQYVDQIIEDHLQRIWVLFNNGTIAVFDEKRRRFHSVKLSGYKEHQERNFVNLFCHKGFFWIQQKHRIARLVLSDQRKENATWHAKVTYVTVLDEQKKEPSRLLNLLFDKEDRLWLSSVANVLIIDKPNSGDTLYAKNFPLPETGDSIDHYGLLQMKNDSLWMSSWSGDLFLLKNEKVVHHNRLTHPERHPGINTLETDANGIKWVRNIGAAVLYDDKNRAFHETGLGSTALYQSRDGTIWSGTEGFGLNSFSPNNSPFLNIGNSGFGIEPNQEMYAGALFKSRKDELLMLNGKVLRLDEKTGKWINHTPWFNQRMINGEITSVAGYLEDSKGRNWIASAGNIFCQQPNGSIRIYRGNTHIADSVGLHRSTVKGIFEDKEQNIWIIHNGLVHHYDDEIQDFVRHFYHIENPPPREDRFNSFLDLSGKLWLATDMGLFIFDKKKEKFSRKWISINGSKLEDVAFSALFQDRSDPNKIWVGTKNKGLYLYNIEEDSWTPYSQKNGLTNNTIYSIAQDSLDRIWLSSNRGLFCYYPEESSWINYRKEHGIQGNEFNARSFSEMADGKFFFGGMNGVTSFYPLTLQKKEQNRPIVLNRFFYEKQVGDSTQIQWVEDLTSAVELSFNDSRRIEFEFAWLNYNQPENHIYAYRLSESGNWIELENQNQLSFYNLNSGDYTLQVKATDWMGNTNKSSLSMPFTILAPWYRTGWAYLTYVLLSIGILTIVFRIRENRKRLKVEASFNHNEALRYKDLEQTKTRFFSNITHEFKTPLTLVIGPLEQLYKEAKGSSEKSLINTAKKNAADLLYLINQLLDLNKMEQGKMPIKYSKGDLALFVSEICNKSKHLAEVKSINLKFSAQPEVIESSFDSRKVERIVINLLSNALKFSPEKTTVEIHLEQIGETIKLQVKDEGPGIPPDKLESIFDQFYQLDGSEKRKFGGTGIGLALVKEYAELLGAEISVKNKPSGGCTFELALPFIKSELANETDFDIDISGLSRRSDQAPETKVMEADKEGVPLLLIAEDNVELNDYLKSCLTPFNVMQAYDGKQAWQMAQEYLPDLILSDYMMPEMTGLEFCIQVKNEDLTSHIPFIILTAKSAIESRVEGLEAGADDYLAKPFNQRELLVRINNLINLRKALREKIESSMQSVKPDRSELELSPKDLAFLEKAEGLVEANLDNGEFEVSDFCAALNISRSQAHRKVKAITNVSVTAFIRSYRLKRALDLIQKEGLIVKEAAYRVGFNSPNYFSKCFHEQFGVSPNQFLPN